LDYESNESIFYFAYGSNCKRRSGRVVGINLDQLPGNPRGELVPLPDRHESENNVMWTGRTARKWEVVK